MDAAWLKRVGPWGFLIWTAMVVLLVLLILNSRKPNLNEVVASALIPMIVFPIADFVDGRRKGRSIPRRIGHTLLSLVGLAVFIATFYALEFMFGRPRNVDPFSESIDPAARYLAAIFLIVLAWAGIAMQFDFRPWARKRDP